MTGTTQSITLANGRMIDLYLGGDPDGRPLVMHHGTPSDATTFADWDEDCANLNLRLICMSRPGYAGSPRMVGRTVRDIAILTAELLDRLGHTEFHTAGWSGGGPHALACAAELAGRCRGVAVLAGVGPYGEPDLDFLAGMGPENVEEFTAAAQGESALRAWMQANAQSFRTVTGAQVTAMLGSLICPPDHAALAGPYADALAAVFRRALADGFDGWMDDDIAFARSWGFALTDVRVPTALWQGDLDLMVPCQHATWLAAHIPDARLHRVPGHGHISLVARHRHEILTALMAP